ncbi:MAG: glycosyltransferase family 2 protein [Verrucomicrobia bacterium]|nr:glycosyltransferase family 2 protein [Verrucomicrobiota bacterium]
MTVAICTRNRAALLREAVDSVLSQLRPDTEVVIVDNASTDDTPAVAAAFAQSNGAVTVVCETELGLSVARNTALRVARGEFVIFLDDDATAEPGWLNCYAELFARPPVENLIGAGGAVFPRYDAPTPRWLDPRANVLNWHPEPCAFKGRGGPWGCNFALHRARTLALGGFNPALGRKGKGMGAHEETDLFEKLRREGGVFWWLPQARIRHRVASERLTLGFQMRGEFTGGRSSALYRLHLQPGGVRRAIFRIGRALLVPIQCLLCLIAVMVTAPFERFRIAAGLLFRGARNAGFGLQLLLGTGPAEQGRAKMMNGDKPALIP